MPDTTIQPQRLIDALTTNGWQITDRPGNGAYVRLTQPGGEAGTLVIPADATAHEFRFSLGTALSVLARYADTGRRATAVLASLSAPRCICPYGRLDHHGQPELLPQGTDPNCPHCYPTAPAADSGPTPRAQSTKPDDMYRERYFEVQEVLDKALGPNEEDGAGEGIVADVMLLAQQRDEARTAVAAEIVAAVRARATDVDHTTEFGRALTYVLGVIQSVPSWTGLGLSGAAQRATTPPVAPIAPGVDLGDTWLPADLPPPMQLCSDKAGPHESHEQRDPDDLDVLIECPGIPGPQG